MRKRVGFTLVELLVVIGIIAVLLAILLPSLRRARVHAQRIACASNLRQIATAWFSYTDANRGQLPAAADQNMPRPHDFLVWANPITPEKLDRSVLSEFLGKPLNPMIFRCPTDDWRGRKDFDYVPVTQSGEYYFSYSMNIYLSNTYPFPPYPINLRRSSILKPQEKIIMIEEDERVISDGVWAPRWAGGWATADEIASRHGTDPSALGRGYWNDHSVDERKRANAFFADAHVDFVNGTYAYDPQHLLADPPISPNP